MLRIAITAHMPKAVEVIFDPARVSYRQILELFFQIHDQTTRNRQGNGRRYQLPICDLLH